MKINISIDDVSPHPKSSIKVIDNCLSVIREFPNVKFSLFVPVGYWRTVKPGIATEKPLFIHLFEDFCESLKQLPPENFEIGYHGLYHGIPGISDNDEFQSITYEEACQKFDIMFEISKLAGLDKVFKPIFRPPAWRMSPGAIRAAKDKGIKILALSPDDYALKTYEGEQNNFNRVVFYNCNPPFKLLKHFDNNEIVYHACEWDMNYFSESAQIELTNWLKSQEHVQFCFLDNL